MAEIKKGRPAKPKQVEKATESERSELVEVVANDIKRKPTKYRTEDGMRRK